MGLFAAQRLRFIFAVYLALSVLGVFTFAAVPDIAAFDFWKTEPMTDGSISSMDADYTIDCFAEYNVKARGQSPLSSRKSAHVMTFFGTLRAGIDTSLIAMKIAKPVKVPSSKSTLLLKLRI
ncbi:MAG: hypothetical protein LBL31_00490 [Spirochaetaceae bacterium]|jgi:hypothetical protein|nr:hypothetical protein [Spirochaetaceae bacterium]